MADVQRFRSRWSGVAPRLLVAGGIAAALLAGAGVALEYRARRMEVARLAALLGLHDGMTVAEIGAGSGWLTVEVARRVAPTGRVYSTELSPARLGDIQQAVSSARLSNVTVIPAGERATNLPAGCCDAVFMRRVYHHLVDPRTILASIHEALRPGGRLVIIDFRREGLLGRLTRMGARPDDVMATVGAAGFSRLAADDWPGWDHYVVMAEKPAAVAAGDALAPSRPVARMLLGPGTTRPAR